MLVVVRAIYDQGSDSLTYSNNGEHEIITNANQPLNLTMVAEEYAQQAKTVIGTFFSPGLIEFYVIFFATLGSVIYLYNRRRKAMKRFLTRVLTTS